MNESNRHGANLFDPLGEKLRPRRGLRLGLIIAILLVVGYFIGRSIWLERSVIYAHPWQLHLGWLLCAALLTWLVFMIIIHIWRLLLFNVSGKRLRFGKAFRITVLSNLGKYVPGKVWSVLGMVLFLRHEGYSTPSAVASTVLHQAFTIISGMIIIAIVLGRQIFSDMPLAPLILGLVLVAPIVYPPLFSGLLNWGLRILKREPITIQLSIARRMGLFTGNIAGWLVYGISFWCLLKGVGIDPGPFWFTVATFDAAYLLGFLAVFAPGGLGVREGVLAVLLAPQLGPGMAAMVAVVARLWMTIMELTELIPLAFGWGRLKSSGVKSS